MDSPWRSLLFRPGANVSAITRDDEAPILVLVPILSGIVMVLAWGVNLHGVLTPATQVAAALLLGPPLVLVASWLGRLCISGVSRILGGKGGRQGLIGIMAWSWLPLLYLSLAALPFSRLDRGVEVLTALQLAGIIWQVVIIGAAVRRLFLFSLLRVSFLMLLSLLLCLALVSGAGYGLAALTGDLFKLAGAV